MTLVSNQHFWTLPYVESYPEAHMHVSLAAVEAPRSRGAGLTVIDVPGSQALTPLIDFSALWMQGFVFSRMEGLQLQNPSIMRSRSKHTAGTELGYSRQEPVQDSLFAAAGAVLPVRTILDSSLIEVCIAGDFKALPFHLSALLTNSWYLNDHQCLE